MLKFINNLYKESCKRTNILTCEIVILTFLFSVTISLFVEIYEYLVTCYKNGVTLEYICCLKTIYKVG